MPSWSFLDCCTIVSRTASDGRRMGFGTKSHPTVDKMHFAGWIFDGNGVGQYHLHLPGRWPLHACRLVRARVLLVLVRLQSSTALKLNHCDGTFLGGEWGRALADAITRRVPRPSRVLHSYLAPVSIDRQPEQVLWCQHHLGNSVHDARGSLDHEYNVDDRGTEKWMDLG